jgi:hypothetical protein
MVAAMSFSYESSLGFAKLRHLVGEGGGGGGGLFIYTAAFLSNLVSGL